jgi:N-acetylglucosamine-6-phosphate deacetylase
MHRFHNHLWPQLAEDRLTAGLIGDGHHLPPEVVKVFLRAKMPQRCVLVSDLSGQAGQPPGRYSSPFCEIEILPDGRLVVAGQRELMGGASLPLGVGVVNVMRFAGLSLHSAIRMALHHPAAVLGIAPGEIEAEAVADLVQFDLPSAEEPVGATGLKVRATLVSGRVVHGTAWRA